MIRLRIDQILEEQGHSKYWLHKQLGMSYQNFNRIYNNETSSIRFDILAKLHTILNVSYDELFEEISDKAE